MLSFLTELFQLGLGYSALNTARTVISVVMQSDQETTVGVHPKVLRFLKGIYELQTPVLPYQHTWDVQIVLNHFKTLERNEDLSLKDLTKQLHALLLLPFRVQTLHMVRLSCVQVHDKGCTIQIMDTLKHSRPGHHQSALELQIFEQD